MQEQPYNLLTDVNASDLLKYHRVEELHQYYGVLRTMLTNFNQMILNANMQGGSFLLALISGAMLLLSQDKLLYQLGSVIVLFGAAMLCRNLQAQVDFFVGMLSQTTKIAETVETLMLALPNPAGGIRSWDNILITKKLRQDFPGAKFLRRRTRFFRILQCVLWILIVFSIVVILYKLRQQLGTSLENDIEVLTEVLTKRIKRWFFPGPNVTNANF